MPMKFEPSDLYSRLLMSDSDLDSLEIVPLGGPEGSDEPFEVPNELAILPIRQTVLFPGMVIPVTVVRQKAIRLVKKIYRNSDINMRILGAVTQAKPNKEDPTADDLHKIGTVAHILKMITLPDGNVTIIVQGRQRFEIKKILSEDPYLTAEVEAIEDSFVAPTKKESKALLQSLRDGAHKIMRLNPEIPQEARIALDNIESPVFLIHFLSSNINVEVADKQRLLEERNGHKQATLLLQYMMREIEMLELKREIQSKASSDIDQQQRDYYLRQQIKVLHDELGIDSPERDMDDIRAKASQKKWSDSTRAHFDKELAKLQRINPMAPEYPVTLNYLETLVDLPWGEYTKDNFDLVRAQKVLDSDHFGLEKVKERIIEYLAVLKLKGNLKAPILCLYGPPVV